MGNNSNDTLKKNPLSMQIDLSKFSEESFAPATEEEKRICAEVTGFSYDRLWRRENAVSLISPAGQENNPNEK